MLRSHWSRLTSVFIAILFALILALRAQRKDAVVSKQMLYRTVRVDGLNIFYREAGPKDAHTILLLHGLPSSSRMFQPLLGRLSDNYRLIAPDYPGFGHSDWPDPKQFDYTFDHIARHGRLHTGNWTYSVRALHAGLRHPSRLQNDPG